ncbi:MAG: HK97 family phage prohead protease [Rhodobacteraceae bacterium]|nr:HK97 family phage prohead protease [Paracoccaceae bacterium]
MWETIGAPGLETKFCRVSGVTVGDDATVEGYASLFGTVDQGGDAVLPGAFAASLKSGRRIKMLWQHDPLQPIGVWDDVREDDRGLWVRGRILTDVARGREAAALVAAGAIDGLSIGYRTRRAERDGKGRRLLAEVELWEVSIVTFPMLSQARVGTKEAEGPEETTLRELAEALQEARRLMGRD